MKLFSLLAPILLLIAVACGSQAEPPTEATPTAALEAQSDAASAPDFSFTLYQGEAELGGKTLAFSKLRGKPIVLNFWAGLCPPCRAEMPDLQAFHDEFKDQAILIGIDIGPFVGLGSQQDARGLLKELDITYPAGYPDDGNIVRNYEVLGMPTSVFIDSQGQIFEKWTGALNLDILRRTTDAMLKQEARSGS